ncbi:MAG: acetolactate decarboxylase [Pseudomonadota bacterium]
MSLDDTFIRAFHAHLASGDLFKHDAAHAVFQASTINAILEGVYDGQTSFAELARHGDFGLGTFDALDGEMTALDGAFFQTTSDGRVHPVAPNMTTPFAVMIFFDPTIEIPITEEMDIAGLSGALDRAVPSKNVFYAIKCRGHFEAIRVRSVPRQEKPYPPLIEVVAHQPVYDYEDIDGTLVGFRFPDYAQGLNVPGYHLHFLSDDRQAGGHVTRFSTRQAQLEIDVTSQFQMALPHDDAFLTAELAKDTRETIKKAEG